MDVLNVTRQSRGEGPSVHARVETAGQQDVPEAGPVGGKHYLAHVLRR